MPDREQAIVTIHKVLVHKTGNGMLGGPGIGAVPIGADEWELKFEVADQVAVFRFGDVREGSELPINRAFLADLDARAALQLRVSGIALDPASDGVPLPPATRAITHLERWSEGCSEAVIAQEHPVYAYSFTYDVYRCAEPAALAEAPLHVYAATHDGHLLWYAHGRLDGDSRWIGPKAVASGWNAYAQVFSIDDVFYGVRADGALIWHRHLGSADGGAVWVEPRQVGEGWQHFRKIFGAGDGVIYAIDPDGVLWWYRHRSYRVGEAGVWDGPKQVGEGWNEFAQVAADGDGVIYAVVGHSAPTGLIHGGGKYRQGDLLWHRHAGQQTGAGAWFEPRRIGRGWDNFSHVFSDGAGSLYAIVAADAPPYRQGDLLSYRHLDPVTGARQWSDTCRAGSGWGGLRAVFGAMPSPP